MFIFGFALLSIVSSWPIQVGQVSSQKTHIQKTSLLRNMEKAFVMQNPPTGQEIARNIFRRRTDTREKLEQAWTGSFRGRDLFQERGGWIYANPINPNQLQVVLAPATASRPFRSTEIANPAIDLEGAATANARHGWVLVANFHTHPLNINQEPSAADLRNAFRRGVPGIVISRRSVYIYGPENRANLNPIGNPRAYPANNNMVNFNPNVRSSVRAVSVNPFPLPALATMKLASILLELIE